MRATELRSNTAEKDTGHQRIGGELSDQQAYDQRWKANADEPGTKDVARASRA